ncbi:MAG: hypothetical protein OXJ53_13660 [Gammaproteobacteria bacterium]|nr:hypothetical protein [Gammaproteobacteria bacterium]MDE0273934.1 hypothetical protein [Gammaproteobacteria bacterium]
MNMVSTERTGKDGKMQLSEQLRSNLIGLGITAARVPVLREESLSVFEAVKAAWPESPASVVGTAIVYLRGDGDLDKACRYLADEGVGVDSGPVLARAFLAAYLCSAKRIREAEQMARSVLAEGGDEEAVALARSLLDNEIRAG